jgi:hypothetical protein
MKSEKRKMMLIVIGVMMLVSSCFSGTVGRVASPNKTYSHVYELNLTRDMKNPLVEFTKIANAMELVLSNEIGDSVLLSKPANPSLKNMTYGKEEWPYITLTSKSAKRLQITVKLTGNWGYADKDTADKIMEQIKNELSINGYL